VQYKAFQYAAYSPEEWIQNAATSRALSAIEEVAKNEVERMIKDPTVTSIPADKDTIVMNCTQPTAKQIQDEQTTKYVQNAQDQDQEQVS
jgi:hypothetical protein